MLGVCLVAQRLVEAECKWCLTGTPIQNSAEDLYALVSRVKKKQVKTMLMREMLGGPSTLNLHSCGAG